MSVLVQHRLTIHPVQTHAHLAARRIEGRLHRGESGNQEHRFFIEPDIRRYRSVAPVVVLRVPAVFAVLMEQRLVLRSPISLSRYFAAPVERIDDTVNTRLTLEG